MSDVKLAILAPRRSLREVLRASPVQTRPVELQAALLEGETDVADQAKFVWRLSWTGTYRTYSTQIAWASAATGALPVGGDRLIVEARYSGRRYRASMPVRITGANPTREEIAAAIGRDEVLKALCWAESTWRQFDRHGDPLKNKGSSARGIAQIMERFWARSETIRHNDYARIAWQWDYCVEAAREILVHYTRSSGRRSRPPRVLNSSPGCWRRITTDRQRSRAPRRRRAWSTRRRSSTTWRRNRGRRSEHVRGG